ncbi:MAG: MFS transporter [Dehalococcoidia bacterium]|nr:MFS transporter [Dehalococcoidia bacterium]
MSSHHDRILSRDFVLICLSGICFFIGFVLFFPTLPLYIQELGGSKTLIGLLVGGAGGVSIVLRPFTGRLVDRYGRKRFAVLGAMLLCIAAPGYNLASSTALIWPVRLLAGAGISIFFTASLAYVGDLAPADKRGRIMSNYGLVSTAAMVFAPLLGAWIVSSAVLSGTEARVQHWLPGSGSQVSGDYNFAVLFVFAGAIALASALFALGIRERHIPSPAVPMPLRRNFLSLFSRAGAVPGVIHFMIVTNTVALNVFIPVYAKEVGLSNAGLYYMVFAIAVIGVRFVSGHALDKYPRAYSIVPAIILIAVGTWCIAVVQTPAGVLIGAAIAGTGQGVAQPGIQAMVVDRAKGKNLGAAMATFALGLDVGLLGGGVLMGAIVDVSSFRVLFLAAGGFSVLGAATLGAITWRERRAAPAPMTLP